MFSGLLILASCSGTGKHEKNDLKKDSIQPKCYDPAPPMDTLGVDKND